MGEALSAAIIVAGIAVGGLGILAALIAIILGCIALFFYWIYDVRKPLTFFRFPANPLFSPLPHQWWESEAVFNPAAVVHEGAVHLFYRALGRDGISRIGYAKSLDGIHFERLPNPVYAAENIEEARNHHPYTSPSRLSYDTVLYASGGGWGGCEDPRAVMIDGHVYLTFNMFNGWHSMRVAITSIAGVDLSQQRFDWRRFRYLSRPGERHKNWVLFPEKIGGKYALFHNLYTGDPSRVRVSYMDELDMSKAPYQHESPDPHHLPDHYVAWHNRTRSAASPPIKTSEGWLLLYHAMDKDDPNRYKVGALLLDLDDPTKVLFRSSKPVLAPDAWYENDWKAGIMYASGAVVFNGDLLVYYGGGDKHVAAAKANLRDFLRRLTHDEHAVLEPLENISVH
ncbi:hypothetical protein H7X87_04390 [Acetobacteraceae bacterium]|nr:hypothetical protein [Candidatus Parcubacteria bacterium]